jgi:NAD+ kinase
MSEIWHGFKNFALLADKTEKARNAYKNLSSRYNFLDIEHNLEEVECFLVLGGDGFMLECLHKYMKLEVPFYGLNRGSVGFLMNPYRDENLFDRVNRSHSARLNPLRMFARTLDGKEHRRLAINEVSLHRGSKQAAKVKVAVDHVERIHEMICDGVIVSTAAGSTAYNSSANGPILPLGSNIIALTPISVFRPRRWRGALLPDSSTIYFEVIEATKRPVSAVADFMEVKDISYVEVTKYNKLDIELLFDAEESLQERIVREQFEL